MACAARLWAPLRDEQDAPDAVRGRALERLRLFVDAYGVARDERARVVDAVLPTHDWAYDIVREAVTRGHPSFDEHWREGGRLRAERTRAWIVANRDAMRAAVEGRLRPSP